MNNKTIGIIVGVLVLVGLAFLLMRNKNGDTNEVASNTATTDTKSQAASESTSIKSLLASGGSKKCTFTSTEGATSSNGTVYVAGGKFRGDFSATANGKVMGSHMISSGTDSYMWMDGMTTGFKMKLDDTAKTGTTAQSQSVDPNKNFDFKCDSWSADNSMFSLPSGVQFSDMSSMMGGASGSVPGGANMTATCAGLSEPAKSQCMAAIKVK